MNTFLNRILRRRPKAPRWEAAPEFTLPEGVTLRSLVDLDATIYVERGDTFELVYQPPAGPAQTVLTERIDRPMLIDRAVIFEVNGILGLKTGIGGAFGEAQ